MPDWQDALRATLNINVGGIAEGIHNANLEAYTAAFKQTIKDATLFNERIKDHIATNVRKWADTAQESILTSMQDELTTAIQNAIDGEMPMNELADKIEEMIDHHGELVARTEMNKAINTAKFEAYKANGATHKQWMHINKTDTGRIQHQEFEDRGPIPIDEEYDEGLQHPGDPNASLNHLCNCACTIVESAGPDEEENQPEEYGNDEPNAS